MAKPRKTTRPSTTTKRQLPHPQATPYTATAVSLHWLIALLIVGNLVFGWLLAEDFWDKPFLFTLVGWHKSIGVLVLALAATRLTYRITRPYPGYVRMPRWMELAAEANHYALYVMMFWMPLTGYALSTYGGHPVPFFGLFTLPSLLPNDPEMGKQAYQLHVIGEWVLWGLISLHIIAALYHQVIRRDGTLGRMLPFLQDIGQPGK